MAAIKYIKRTVALDGSSISEPLPASFFNSESSAHTFIIAGQRDGAAVAFTGAVSAIFHNPNDVDVLLDTCSIVDGAAVVTLTDDCYALSGRFTLTIDVNGATVYECQSRIKRRSSGTAYDPNDELTVAALSAEIAAMRTATAAANTAATAADTARENMEGIIATTFNTTTQYHAGEYVWYNGELYQYNVNHDAGSWDATQAVKVPLSKAVGEMQDEARIYQYLTNNGQYTVTADDMENGGWGYSTKVNNTKRVRNANLIPVRAGMQIAYSNPTLKVAFSVLPNKTAGSYSQLGSWTVPGGSGVVNITKDGYLVFLCESPDGSNITVADYDCTITIYTKDQIKTQNLIEHNIYNYILDGDLENNVSNGITFETEDGVNWIVSGSSDSAGAAHVFSNNDKIPAPIKSTGMCYVKATSSNSDVRLRIRFRDADGNLIDPLYQFISPRYLTVPASAVAWNVTLYVMGNVTLSQPATVSNIAILAAKTNSDIDNDLHGFIDKTTHTFEEYNSYNLIEDIRRVSGTSHGISYEWNGYECTVKSGTASDASANILLDKQNLPSTVIPGKEYYVRYLTTDETVRLRIIFYNANGNNINKTKYYPRSRLQLIPEDAVMWNISLYITSGTVLTEDVVVSDIAILDCEEKPWINGGGGGGDTIIYENTYNTYDQNTYNITCNPTITTDTNNFLASTNDNTDRTADIQAMLQSTGVCHLGPGTFVVKKLEIPVYCQLIGSGNKTVLKLKDQETPGDEEYSYAVCLKSYASIENMLIRGTNDMLPWIDLPSTVDENKLPIGKRHGILFEGTLHDDDTQDSTYYRSRVTRCTIANFTGAGIICNNTGLSPASHLLISLCEVLHCGIGVATYFSEFNRIVACAFQENYYGMVNNGGNTSMSTCDLSKNIVNLAMDENIGTFRNNTHGTISACQFAHPVGEDGTANAGTMMRIIGGQNSFMFVGCRFGNGKTEIRDSIGIIFSACRFSFSENTLANNKFVQYNNCFFRISYRTRPRGFTLSGNEALHFNECYYEPGKIDNVYYPTELFDPSPYKKDVPPLPSADGVYVLRATIANGNETLEWVAQQ